MGRKKYDDTISEQLKEAVKNWQEGQEGSRWQQEKAPAYDRGATRTTLSRGMTPVYDRGADVSRPDKGARNPLHDRGADVPRPDRGARNAVVDQQRQKQIERERERAEAQAYTAEANRIYEEYLNSEEYAEKKNEERAPTALRISPQVKLMGENKEADEYKNVVAYYENQEAMLEDRYLMEDDLEELATWDEEGRRVVDDFLSGKALAILLKENPGVAQKYGEQRIREMAESLWRSRNQKAAEMVTEDGRALANDGFWGSAIGTGEAIGDSLLATVSAPLTWMEEGRISTGRYHTLDPNAGGRIYSQRSDAIISQVAENIENGNGFLGDLGAWAYRGGVGAADNLLRIAVGGGTSVGTLGLMAVGSFDKTLAETSARGASPGEAILTATAGAGIEVITEKIGLDELFRAGKSGLKGARQAVVAAMRQGGVEVAEEEIAFLSNLVVEAAVLREKSSYNQQIGELVANGMSYDDAKNQANLGLWEEALDTAVTSWVSGSVMSGAQSAGRHITQQGTTIPGAPEQVTVDGLADDILRNQQENAPQDAVPEADPAADFNRVAAEVIPREQAVQEPEPEYSDDVFRAAVDEMMGAQAQKNTDQQSGRQGANETAGIKQQIQASQETLAGMEPVAQINTPREFARMNIAEKMKWVIEKLRPTNYQVDRKGFGIINFSAKQIKQAFKYFPKGGAEEASFEAIPYVLKNGTEISSHENHKGREYSTVTFAAPVNINGKRGNMAVVVKQTKDNRYKIHRVFSPDGSMFELSETTIEAEPTPGGGVTENGSLATPISSASNNNIADDGGNVNGQNGAKGFEAMGAADYNFSPYTRMQNEYGNIPEGENPVRPDDAPISTDGTDRVSRTARTAIGAEVTPDEFVPMIENEVVRGGFSYIPITNNETVQRAMTAITTNGWERSRGAWEQQVRNGQTSADIIAMGALLYNNAVNSGDSAAAMDILLDYQQATRNAGQAVQAARILKQLTPENRLYMIRRSVQRMVEDMHLDTPITIDENLARQYQQAADDTEADSILDEIARDVAQQIPSTFAERFADLRYLNMLGNFRTQVRNFSGNVGAKFTYLAKDELAATIEALASGMSGGRFQRTKVHIVDRTTRNAGRADYENVADWISGGGRTQDRADASTDFERRVQENRRILPAGMEQYRRATNWAMNNRFFGDAAFGREAYARALAGYLNARGIRTDNLDTVDPETLNAAREYAVRQAQEATFRDNNWVSEFVSRALRRNDTPWGVRMIGEAIMPFRKTPANVLVRAEEFSPLGLINSAVATVQAARGNISGAELVDSWAKSLTGTGLFVLGWALANMGFLRGGPDEDEEKAEFDRLNGYQDYSIQLPGGVNFTIDAFSPTALPLLLGGQLDKVLDGDMTWADLEGVFYTLADPMIEMSMLSGLNDTIDAIRYADNSLGQFLVNASFNYLTQAFGNTLLGQMERSTEESRMTTYIDKDSNIPVWLQRNLGKLSQKIPGWDYQQTPYIDQWGREQKNPEGIKGWAYNLFSPSYIGKAEVDAVAQELYRLNEAQSDVNVFPQSPEATVTYTDKDGNRHENYNLSMAEANKLKRTEGQAQAKLVADLIGGEDYAALTDKQKAEAISLVYEYARELARGEVLSGYDGMKSWMQGIEGQETETIIAKVAGADLGDAMTSLTTAWKEGYADDTGAMEGLEEAYQVYKGLSEPMQETVFEGLSERVKGYIEARDGGQEPESYMGAAKAVTLAEHHIDALRDAWKEGEDGSATFTDLDQAYELYRGLDEEQRKQVLEMASSKTRHFLEAREAGVNTETYTRLYQQYDQISGGDGSGVEQAEEWSHVLQKSVEAGQITQEQADTLREEMGIFQIIPAEAKKYNDLTAAGISADDTKDVLWLLDGLEIQEGYSGVRDAQKWEAIAEASFLSDQEKDTVMKIYMPDYDPAAREPNKTELKYDYARQVFGLTPELYVAAYQAHVGNSKKADKLEAWEEMGFSSSEANMLYRLFASSGKDKIDVVAWYEQQQAK